MSDLLRLYPLREWNETAAIPAVSVPVGGPYVLEWTPKSCTGSGRSVLWDTTKTLKFKVYPGQAFGDLSSAVPFDAWYASTE
jgi:hypothetical protein